MQKNTTAHSLKEESPSSYPHRNDKRTVLLAVHKTDSPNSFTEENVTYLRIPADRMVTRSLLRGASPVLDELHKQSAHFDMLEQKQKQKQQEVKKRGRTFHLSTTNSVEARVNGHARVMASGESKSNLLHPRESASDSALTRIVVGGLLRCVCNAFLVNTQETLVECARCRNYCHPACVGVDHAQLKALMQMRQQRNFPLSSVSERVMDSAEFVCPYCTGEINTASSSSTPLSAAVGPGSPLPRNIDDHADKHPTSPDDEKYKKRERKNTSVTTEYDAVNHSLGETRKYRKSKLETVSQTSKDRGTRKRYVYVTDTVRKRGRPRTNFKDAKDREEYMKKHVRLVRRRIAVDNPSLNDVSLDSVSDESSDYEESSSSRDGSSVKENSSAFDNKATASTSKKNEDSVSFTKNITHSPEEKRNTVEFEKPSSSFAPSGHLRQSPAPRQVPLRLREVPDKTPDSPQLVQNLQYTIARLHHVVKEMGEYEILHIPPVLTLASTGSLGWNSELVTIKNEIEVEHELTDEMIQQSLDCCADAIREATFSENYPKYCLKELRATSPSHHKYMQGTFLVSKRTQRVVSLVLSNGMDVYGDLKPTVTHLKSAVSRGLVPPSQRTDFMLQCTALTDFSDFVHVTLSATHPLYQRRGLAKLLMALDLLKWALRGRVRAFLNMAIEKKLVTVKEEDIHLQNCPKKPLANSNSVGHSASTQGTPTSQTISEKDESTSIITRVEYTAPPASRKLYESFGFMDVYPRYDRITHEERWTAREADMGRVMVNLNFTEDVLRIATDLIRRYEAVLSDIHSPYSRNRSQLDSSSGDNRRKRLVLRKS